MCKLVQQGAAGCSSRLLGGPAEASIHQIASSTWAGREPLPAHRVCSTPSCPSAAGGWGGCWGAGGTTRAPLTGPASQAGSWDIPGNWGPSWASWAMLRSRATIMIPSFPSTAIPLHQQAWHHDASLFENDDLGTTASFCEAASPWPESREVLPRAASFSRTVHSIPLLPKASRLA